MHDKVANSTEEMCDNVANSGDGTATNNEVNEERGWQPINRKRAGSSSVSVEDSPTPPITLKNLQKMDEVEAKRMAANSTLSKSQLKKLKKKQGSASPQST